MVDVAEDDVLRPEEKEVIIRWAKDEDRLSVHSEHASVTRWLMEHPDFEVVERREKDGALCAVRGELPVGALNLSGRPRKSNQTARVLGKFPDRVKADD